MEVQKSQKGADDIIMKQMLTASGNKLFSSALHVTFIVSTRSISLVLAPLA